MAEKNVTVESLREFAERFGETEAERPGIERWWQSPLLVSASVDRRFDQLPEIAYHEHIYPRDLLPTARSVVVFFVPFAKALVKENRAGDRPCRDWGVAYVQTNDLIDRLSKGLSELLAENGFESALSLAKRAVVVNHRPHTQPKRRGIGRDFRPSVGRLVWGRFQQAEIGSRQLAHLSRGNGCYRLGQNSADIIEISHASAHLPLDDLSQNRGRLGSNQHALPRLCRLEQIPQELRVPAKAGSLFNLKKDPGETIDVSHQHPEVVEELQQRFKTAMKELEANTRDIGRVGN